jgi:hypothetical protein
MEWILSLIPIALVVLVCGGMHLLMMRGMHAKHGSASPHDGRHGQESLRMQGLPRPTQLTRDSQALDGSEAARVAELERQVTELQQQIDEMLTYPQRAGSDSPGRVTTRHAHDAWRNDSARDGGPAEADGGCRR